MKKIFYVLIVVVLLFIGFIGFTYSYEYNDGVTLKFELIGDSSMYMGVGEQYKELGVNVYIDGEKINSLVNIKSDLDVNKIGKYVVRYEVEIGGVIEYITRNIYVVDTIAPTIKLRGDDVVYINQGDMYFEDGYDIVDNYNSLDECNVTVVNNVDVSKQGEYFVSYIVRDTSGNEGMVTRKVIVQ